MKPLCPTDTRVSNGKESKHQFVLIVCHLAFSQSNPQAFNLYPAIVIVFLYARFFFCFTFCIRKGQFFFFIVYQKCFLRAEWLAVFLYFCVSSKSLSESKKIQLDFYTNDCLARCPLKQNCTSEVFENDVIQAQSSGNLVSLVVTKLHVCY